MALTKREIDAARYQGDGASRDIRFDGDDGLPGFGLRIYPSGRRSFVLQYRHRNRVRLLTLGQYGVLTLSEARQRARKHLVQVGDGRDPLEERQAPDQDYTLERFADVFMERHSKARKKSWREDERRLRSYLLPALGRRALDTIGRSDLAALHSEIGRDRPVEANRVLALASTIFSKAEEWGFLPGGSPNPAKGVSRYTERSRDRWLRADELQRLIEALHGEDVFIRGAVLLYLLTGLRKTELLSARWDRVDFDGGRLFLADTKSGRPHSVPLSSAARMVLERLPREAGSPWVFPGIDGAHRKDWRGPWSRVRKRAGLDGVRLHDLRRTVGSLMAQAGVPLQVIGEILNHTHPAVTKVYARLGESQPREALETHGRHLLDLAGDSEPLLGSGRVAP